MPAETVAICQDCKGIGIREAEITLAIPGASDLQQTFQQPCKQCNGAGYLLPSCLPSKAFKGCKMELPQQQDSKPDALEAELKATKEESKVARLALDETRTAMEGLQTEMKDVKAQLATVQQAIRLLASCHVLPCAEQQRPPVSAQWKVQIDKRFKRQ